MVVMLDRLRFEDPYWLLLIPILLGLLAYQLFIAKQKQETYLTYTNISRIVYEASWKEKLWWLPKLFALLSIFSFIIAMARPQLTLDEVAEKAEGIDIVIAVDLSTSMLAMDFEPNRLEEAKKVAAEFVDNRKFDRIGLVVLEGSGFTKSPLTTDHNVIKDYLADLQAGSIQRGTAIGMGLAVGVNRLKNSEAKSKIIVLMTDGENNSGYIDPATAIELAKTENIKVYTIGIGSSGYVDMPDTNPFTGAQYISKVRVNIDEALLQQIATETGGKYVHAKDGASLKAIYNTIDQLEKTEIETTVFKRYTDLFRNLIIVGILLLLLFIIMHYKILQILP